MVHKWYIEKTLALMNKMTTTKNSKNQFAFILFIYLWRWVYIHTDDIIKINTYAHP